MAWNCKLCPGPVLRPPCGLINCVSCRAKLEAAKKTQPPHLRRIVKRLARPLWREPDFYIGGKEKPYIRRWWLTDRVPEKWRTYLHNFLRDDDDRALHDHPGDSCSIILVGGYIEHFPDGRKKLRLPGMIVFRRAEQAHRIELRRRKDGTIIPAWTIFIFAPKRREWGFHCPKGWVHWKDFVDETDSGNVGKGCGE